MSEVVQPPKHTAAETWYSQPRKKNKYNIDRETVPYTMFPTPTPHTSEYFSNVSRSGAHSRGTPDTNINTDTPVPNDN